MNTNRARKPIKKVSINLRNEYQHSSSNCVVTRALKLYHLEWELQLMKLTFQNNTQMYIFYSEKNSSDYFQTAIFEEITHCHKYTHCEIHDWGLVNIRKLQTAPLKLIISIATKLITKHWIIWCNSTTEGRCYIMLYLIFLTRSGTRNFTLWLTACELGNQFPKRFNIIRNKLKLATVRTLHVTQSHTLQTILIFYSSTNDNIRQLVQEMAKSR